MTKFEYEIYKLVYPIVEYISLLLYDLQLLRARLKVVYTKYRIDRQESKGRKVYL